MVDHAMSHVIVMTMYKRFDYTHRVLEAISKCVGVEKYRIFLHCDPGCGEVESLIRGFPLPGKEVVIHPERVGCTANTFSALFHGFQASDYVIALEDDVVPAPDALQFFEHCRDAYRDDKAIFTACAYTRRHAQPSEYYSLTRFQWFTPWGWATWKDRWDATISAWNFTNAPSWDITFNKIRGDRYEVTPVLARTQNIGEQNGTYCSPEHHRDHQFNRYWAGAVTLPGGQFTETANG
jgi:hypothetical protein